MRLISPLLKRVVYPILAKAGYLRRRNGAGPELERKSRGDNLRRQG